MEVRSRRSLESPGFYKEVTSRLGGETLTFCYQCGTCASSCPVAKITRKFNPRTIIREAILGNREKVLSSGAIWLCCSCYNCQERCPQEVEIADLIFSLRNISASLGYAPKAFVEMSSSMIREGRVVPVTKFMMRRREKMGLPPVKETGVEALKKIFSATSFNGSVGGTEEEGR